MRSGDGEPPTRRSDRGRFTRVAVLAALVASIPYLLVLWDAGVRPTRTALPDRTFSNFYDIQARALMRGHLDVPPNSLAFEAFRVGGRDYLYFPPFPSMLRIPLFAVTDRFDGRLTAISMLLAWAVMMTFTALLVWRIRHVVHPGAPLRRLELANSAALIAVVGGGSAIVYLASLPWVYHEAFMWTVATSIGVAWAMIGALVRPSARRIAVAGLLGLAAMLTRVTVGWAWGLALLTAGAVAIIRPRWRLPRREAWYLVGAGLVPLVVGIALNWVKFRHPFMIPLDEQLVAEASPNRRAALAANGGGMTGPQFAPTTLLAYLRPDGIRLTSVFPFITLPAGPPRIVGDTVFDEVYRTGSIVAFMPFLFGLSIAGAVATFRRSAPDAVALLRLPVLGATAATGAVFLFGYVAHRYSAEFVPGLLVLGVVGLVAAEGRLRTSSSRRRRAGIAALAALAVFGVAANTAVGLATSRAVQRGDALVDFLEVRRRIASMTGHPDDGYLSRGQDLSGPAPTDHLRIVDDCASVWLATGNTYEPWIAVEISPVTIPLTATGPGTPLARFDGPTDWTLSVERSGDRQRLLLEGGGSTEVGEWSTAEAQSVVVSADLSRSRYLIESPLLSATVPVNVQDDGWISRPVLVSSPIGNIAGHPFCDRLR